MVRPERLRPYVDSARIELVCLDKVTDILCNASIVEDECGFSVGPPCGGAAVVTPSDLLQRASVEFSGLGVLSVVPQGVCQRNREYWSRRIARSQRPVPDITRAFRQSPRFGEVAK